MKNLLVLKEYCNNQKTSINNLALTVEHDKREGHYAVALAYEGVLMVLDDMISEMTEANNRPEKSYDNMSLAELGAELKNVKSALDDAGEAKTLLQKQFDYLSIEIIPDRMDEQGVDSMKITDVGRLQISSDIRCNIPASNKTAVENWLREHGHESMIVPSINASTFKAFIKERMKEEKEYPSDLITVHPFSRASVVKA